MKKFALIVAGGRGERMGSNVPKQFMSLNGQPVLIHTLRSFHGYSSECSIILVLPESETEIWKELCIKAGFDLPHKIVHGGNTRFDSVKNGLDAISEPSVVAIHDGVRPLISTDIIRNAFDVAEKKGNAVTAVRLKDSVRRVGENGSETIDREALRLVQTPQCFHTGIIKNAYASAQNGNYTDDAAVAEASGIKINLVEGSYSNIKITTPEDLLFAAAIMKQ